MDVRLVWCYAAVPAGGLFMMLYSLERLLQVLQGREQA
jgi:TRAP-type C4-dicarboxylate transport system permease small subunit